jgi:hypothetical protein
MVLLIETNIAKKVMVMMAVQVKNNITMMEMLHMKVGIMLQKN